MSPTLVLAAHGTRSAAGVAVIRELADAVAERGVRTRVGFVDVLGPTPAQVLSGIDGPAVLVPAFLASGYHVRTDVPQNIRDSGRDDVTVTPALGPDVALARLLARRLRDVGYRDGDAVVLAAAGSSDALALADVAEAARLLERFVTGPVRVGYVATAAPTVAEVVAGLRTDGHERIAIASYLLAPGLFHERLRILGADAVGEPLGVAEETVELVLSRYSAALRQADTSS